MTEKQTRCMVVGCDRQAASSGPATGLCQECFDASCRRSLDSEMTVDPDAAPPTDTGAIQERERIVALAKARRDSYVRRSVRVGPGAMREELETSAAALDEFADEAGR